MGWAAGQPVSRIAATLPGLAPANETEFCGDIQNDSNLTGLTTGGGTLTINSCSFSGGVGTVNATVKLTTPVSTSISYTVRYTYS